MRHLSLLLTLLVPTITWAASPTLGVITPRGGQRGTEVEFTFHGARLKDAQEILCYTPGSSPSARLKSSTTTS